MTEYRKAARDRRNNLMEQFTAWKCDPDAEPVSDEWLAFLARDKYHYLWPAAIWQYWSDPSRHKLVASEQLWVEVSEYWTEEQRAIYFPYYLMYLIEIAEKRATQEERDEMVRYAAKEYAAEIVFKFFEDFVWASGPFQKWLDMWPTCFTDDEMRSVFYDAFLSTVSTELSAVCQCLESFSDDMIKTIKFHASLLRETLHLRALCVRRGVLPDLSLFDDAIKGHLD